MEPIELRKKKSSAGSENGSALERQKRTGKEVDSIQMPISRVAPPNIEFEVLMPDIPQTSTLENSGRMISS